LPDLPLNLPLLIDIEPESDADYLRRHFGLEIVAEQNDGVVMVASADDQLQAFFRTLGKFQASERGGATAAKIFRIVGPEGLDERLARLLSPGFLLKWPEIDDEQLYFADLGIECLGAGSISDAPEIEPEETPEHFALRLERWTQRYRALQAEWDDLMAQREDGVLRFVHAYNAEILDILHGAQLPISTLPDSFTVRVRISGAGLKDLVYNYPFLFEVSEPDEIASDISGGAEVPAALPIELHAPDHDAPRVCIIDSGLQEAHPFLAAAMELGRSMSYVPGTLVTDIADYVAPAGHGTGVAGAVLFPHEVPEQGTFQATCWIQNARVLDEDNALSPLLHPPLYLRAIVERLVDQPHPTKLFNHSIAAYRPCRLRQVSAWAATMDVLSWEQDVLFIQSAGNLPDYSSALPYRLGILDHTEAGRHYPTYLLAPSSRIPSPSESLQALTVGSISHAEFEEGAWRSLGGLDRPSGFTTSGPGVWGGIKPELVEYGGDLVYDGQSLTTRPETSLSLIRSTMHGGPLHGRDEVGTSFAAPKVTAVAVEVQRMLPAQPSLLYRALIVNSARWPAWAEESADKLGTIRQIGFGVADVDRATTNSPYRATLISEGVHQIKAKEAHIFTIPVPAALRAPGENFNVRIDVTLSYVARPRRTRRSARKYLSTWVDWDSSKIGESAGSFENRILKDRNAYQIDGEGIIPWMIREQDDWGIIEGVRRNTGTVQKDWAVLKSYQLPVDMCIGVVGHPGWDQSPDAFAKYSLAVTFEAIDQDLEIYEELRASVDALIAVQQQAVEKIALNRLEIER
jgi:hypothetical protein